MMQITVKYKGPTDTRGARFVATGMVDGKRRKVSEAFDYDVSESDQAWDLVLLFLARHIKDKELFDKFYCNPWFQAFDGDGWKFYYTPHMIVRQAGK